MFYGILKENTIIMEGRVFEEGTYLPSYLGMEGWVMKKNLSGYCLTSKENAVYEFNKDGELVHIATGDEKGATYDKMDFKNMNNIISNSLESKV